MLTLFLVIAAFSYICFPLIEMVYEKYKVPILLIPIFILTAGINASSNILGNILISKNKEWIWLFIVTLSFISINIFCLISMQINSVQGAFLILANNLITLLVSTLFFIKTKKEELK